MKKREKALFWAAGLSVLLLVAVCAAVYFALFWRDGRSRRVVQVPQLAGDFDDGVISAEDIEIVKEYTFSEDAPAGWVISQSPGAGACRKLRQGEKCRIRLTVSLGEETHTLPELSGLRYNEALAILRCYGVQVETVYQSRLDQEGGTVLFSHPKNRSEIRAGDKVTLYVSRHPSRGAVRVGNYTRMEQSAALLSLLMDGLTLGEITSLPSSAPLGTVIDQSFPMGTYLPYGTQIDLAVSGGEAGAEEEQLPILGGVTE